MKILLLSLEGQYDTDDTGDEDDSVGNGPDIHEAYWETHIFGEEEDDETYYGQDNGYDQPNETGLLFFGTIAVFVPTMPEESTDDGSYGQESSQDGQNEVKEGPVPTCC